MPSPHRLTVSEAAALAGCTQPALRYHMKRGTLKVAVDKSGKQTLLRSEVEKLKAKSTKMGVPRARKSQ